MFTSYPTYPRFRPLRLGVTPGEDVYALQCALNEVNQAHLTEDGNLGPMTSLAIKSYQQKVAATDPTIGEADGIVGTLTHRALTLAICHMVSKETGVRFLALKGQTEFESGFRSGIYSELHDRGTERESWDSGVVQENSRVFSVMGAFTPLPAVRDMTARIIEHRDHFTEISGDRRLQLAQGTWNAPAWACFIAYEEGARSSWVRARKSRTLSGSQRATIEAYMAHVAVYYIA